MTGVNRVFAAQLAGLPVFGPDGESIGKVRDVVVGLRLDLQPPRVLGVVVELSTRHRVFVPMLRVTSIEPNAVTLATGSVNMRQFHQRPNEVLVLGQLTDAHASLRETGARVTVVDAAMEPLRTRDWVLSKLAVRERTGRLRRSSLQVRPWEEIKGLGLADLVTHGAQGAGQLLMLFDTMRPVDIAATVRDLPTKRKHEVADSMDDERLADVLEELPEDDQKELLQHLSEERAADILEAMNPDDAADLLAEFAPADQNRFLDLMEPEESEPVKRLLAYSSDTAGGLMTPEPVVLTPDATVAEALAHIRNADLPAALATMVFVCRPPSATPTGRYVGVVHFQRLLREPPAEMIAAAVDSDLPALRPGASLSEVTRYFAAYNLACGPVVDAQDHLLGAVTVDDVLDHLLPEDWRETGLRDVTDKEEVEHA
ncbi:magnesium transporter MgtE N-terminal domain-containing protein [Amycolatopsis pithecellobii]|uniref:CBS domain-containing protein n=1 Tax=Amycolatopsis pithecellobii TaxID=664692 RepID=A0A6N7Z101_9PSEU|nr:CBS domain-containing protein [Amycolatopsis pithecellobii]MTD55043.1 CBS domain-containing protein [Amycolatopsis pithecellobii]